MSRPKFDPGASSWFYFDKWRIARDAAEQSCKAGLNLAAQVSKSKAEVIELRKAMRTLSNDYNTLSAERTALIEAHTLRVEAIVRSRSEAEAELAALKERRCWTCKGHVYLSHGGNAYLYHFCPLYGEEFCLDGFCHRWEARP